MASTFCPNCGAKLETETNFCPLCGQLLKQINHPPYQEDKTISEMFFTAKGRLNRLRYFKRSALLIFLEIFFAIIISVTFWEPSIEDITVMGYVLFVVMIIAFTPSHYFLMIRRLHDLNKTGWLCLVTMIPAVNAPFCIYLLFAPGTVGSNQYGADPLEGKR